VATNEFAYWTTVTGNPPATPRFFGAVQSVAADAASGIACATGTAYGGGISAMDAQLFVSPGNGTGTGPGGDQFVMYVRDQEGSWGSCSAEFPAAAAAYTRVATACSAGAAALLHATGVTATVVAALLLATAH
jgi:hypothetical protein